MMVIPEEELEDTKGVIKSSRSKKDRQYNCQKKKEKRQKYKIRSTKYYIEN